VRVYRVPYINKIDFSLHRLTPTTSALCQLKLRYFMGLNVSYTGSVLDRVSLVKKGGAREDGQFRLELGKGEKIVSAEVETEGLFTKSMRVLVFSDPLLR
jgi:hypothetical protein